MEIGKLKVVFILSNGQTLTIKCKKFSMTKLSGTKGEREISVEGADRIWSVDLDEVVGITARWCLL
jgi:hypothetical protein